jgi:hypothetical protein
MTERFTEYEHVTEDELGEESMQTTARPDDCGGDTLSFYHLTAAIFLHCRTPSS